jgi:beta-lactamase superfamily II metal-dependent hydrolase
MSQPASQKQLGEIAVRFQNQKELRIMLSTKRLLSLLFLPLAAAGFFAGARTKTAPNLLELYFIDVEGGAATLVVTPAKETILMDAGWDGFDARDAKRIQQAMRQAGVTAIDHLIASHYHMDHYGGIPELSRLVSIRRFYDHGKMTAMTEDMRFAERYAAYQTAAKAVTTALKPGDTIPLKTAAGAAPLKLLCVAANGEVWRDGNTAANPACAAPPPEEAGASENGRSVGLRLSWGDFDFLNLADLTWNISRDLVCPANQLGEIDLYQATRHGDAANNPPALLQSLRPTAAVMINSPRKGGSPDTVKWLRESPALKAVFQMHRNAQASAGQNADADYIANLDERPDAGHLIKVVVNEAQRAFTITNGRTQKSYDYAVK